MRFLRPSILAAGLCAAFGAAAVPSSADAQVNTRLRITPPSNSPRVAQVPTPAGAPTPAASTPQEPTPATPTPETPTQPPGDPGPGYTERPRIPNDVDEATLQKLIQSRVRSINEIPVNLTPPEGPLPVNYSRLVFQQSSDSYANRQWAMLDFHWQPSELVFQPPYWDDVPLERYGQTISPHWQPIISGGKFFLTFPIMPYKIGIDRTHDHISTLGYYRPGSTAPCVRQRLPWEWDAALFEVGAWSGGFFIFP